MQFKTSYESLLGAFSDSVSKLLEEIDTMNQKVMATDPDPELTRTHHLDKIIRKWFNGGNGLGY